MAGSVNKVIILGNLGKDPEVRTFPNGGKVCNFPVATSETWRDRNSGEKQERTQWHNIAIFSEPLVNIAERFLKKGSKLYIEGQLETRKWQDNAGADRYSTEVVLRPYRGELTLLDNKADSENVTSQPSSELLEKSSDPEKVASFSPDDFDDEIPF
ncbi:MAG: single-stranded DNA-binding protein [Paracoccaceae bacterium]|nr:single-stranded DNA-binding protein [Paracoccaceae bacterium]